MKKKMTALAFALTLVLAVISFAGCSGGGQETRAADITGNTVRGSRVFVHDSNVVFFGYHNYFCSALYEDGDVRDFVVEAGMTGDIYALAVYDGSLFVSASDGIFRYDLGMFSGKEGAAPPAVLTYTPLTGFTNFEIYGGKLFYIYGNELRYIPADGGAEAKVANDAADFEATDNGIYYVTKDGKLRLLSSDFKEDKELAGLAYGCTIAAGGDRIYFRDGQELKAYSITANSVETVETEASLGSNSIPWSNGTNVLYQDGDVHIKAPDGETLIGHEYLFPDSKSYGYVYDDYLFGMSTSYSHMKVMGMAGVNTKDYDLDKELNVMNGGPSGGSGGQDNSGTPEGSGGQSTASGPYDIMAGAEVIHSDGIAYLYFNDFLLIMPDNDEWGYEVTSDNSVTFYLIAAKDSGYGGKLVTITAYDPGDDSYRSHPHYSVGGTGRNVNKVFVATFPTDVQWDTNDSAQGESYRNLEDYLQKIGEGAVNSPLQTADGD